jgi:hypothetical protein
LFQRRAFLPVVAVSAAIALPWYAFATLYYGSPVPHTIVAKSLSFRLGFLSQGWPAVYEYLTESWKCFAPFREFWFAIHTPIPDDALKAIVALVTVLTILGIGSSLFRNQRMLAIAAFVAAFVVYRTGSMLPTYYMWYLPPFLALFFIFAGYGLSSLSFRTPLVATVLGLGLAFVYAMHIPFSFPLESLMQSEVEENVRFKTGLVLNSLMKPQDTAVLEPLGYIGWAARNKTIYDMPGLGSEIAVKAMKNRWDVVTGGLADATSRPLLSCDRVSSITSSSTTHAPPQPITSWRGSKRGLVSPSTTWAIAT